MTSYVLDQSLTLTQQSDDRFRLDARNAYWNYKSAFGGWLAAALAKAVTMRGDFRGEIISLNTTFVSPASAEAYGVSVDLIKRRRTTDFWRLVLTDLETDQPTVTADIVAGARRASDLTYQAEIPAHKSVEDSIPLPPTPMAPKWLKDIEQHMAKGVPLQKNETAETILYTREGDGRPFDVLTAVLMLDTPMPRTFFMGSGVKMASTLSMATFLHAAPEEMAVVGGDYTLLISDCAGAGQSVYTQETRLCRQDGLLLGSSYQIAIFR